METDIIGAFVSDETRPVNANRPLVSDPILYINRTDARYGTVTQSETPLAMEFDVYNLKAQPYTITEVGYKVMMNDLLVSDGTTEETYVSRGGTTETLRTAPTILNDRLNFYARVELPAGNEIRIPLDAPTYERTIETDVFGNKVGSDGDTSTEEAATARATPMAVA
jgi:LEA14-like dessication related protein